MIRFSLTIFLFGCLWLLGCNSSQHTETKTIDSKRGMGVYIFADRNKTGIRVSLKKENATNLVSIQFNKQTLEKTEDVGNRVEFSGSINSFQSENELLINTNDKQQHKFMLNIEPLDFAVEEPFTIHRLQPNEISLSRKFSEQSEIWLSIFDNYIGGFKLIPEFNQNNTAVLIPESETKRLSVGDAKISLYDIRFGRLEDRSGVFYVNYETSYESQIKLNVVH